MAEWLDHFNQTWMLYALALVTTAFPILYVILARIRSVLGVAVISLAAVTAMVIDLQLFLSAIVLPHLVASIISTVVSVVILFAYLVKIVVVIKVQVQDQQDDQHDHLDLDHLDPNEERSER